LSKKEIEEELKNIFGLKRVLWLDNGYLAGDDTDSHIDTLARFCDKRTIAYVRCNDPEDEHFDALHKMEEQLMSFVDYEGNPYRLIPLPMAERIVFDGERLPATYANFLVINGAVLVPAYHTPKDAEAIRQLSVAFPEREIVSLDCSPIIKQHGSLHCIAMQYPEGFVE
jgi:agmatine/peptidylarginine deiminase